MERIVYKFTLDVTKAESQRILTGMRVGESASRQLRISLTNGKSPIALDGLTETVSMFVLKSSDSSPSVNACTIEGDTIVYDVLQSDLSEEGVTTFTLKIVFTSGEETGIAYAATFSALVTNPNCDESHVPSDPTYTILEQLIQEVNDIRQSIVTYDGEAEKWAVGTKDGVPVDPTDPTYHNNSKYYSENVETEVDAEVEKAEAWSSGTKGGTPVSSTDPAYHNNSKYYSEQSASHAQDSSSYASASSTSAGTSANKALDSEAYGAGTRNGVAVQDGDPAYHNNAKYWAEQASGATSGVTSYNGRSGLVVPADGDYAIGQITPTSGTQGQVPMVNSSGKLEMSNLPTSTQVQSDWSQSNSSAVDYIKNKPTIPAAQIQSDWSQSDNTAKDFIKNKPTIPDAQIQSDWNQSDNTAKDYIKNKPTIPTVPSTYAASAITAGTLAGQVLANATAVQTLGTAQVRNISAGTATVGSTLTYGDIYIQYES